MPQIDTILALYPDTATRRSLLSLALTHIQTDLIALCNAIADGDKIAALHHTHQAKGTASFLGVDKQALLQFDQLTHALRHPGGGTATAAEQGRNDVTTPANVELALKAVTAILRELETSLLALIQELENS